LPTGTSPGPGRRRPTAALALVLGAGLAVAAAAQESPGEQRDEPAAVAIEELTPETRTAIERGVAWLAREQNSRSGTWPCRPKRYRMSITSLCGLALLAHGDTPDSGRYAENVRKAVRWILDNQWREGEYAGLFFDSRQIVQDDRATHGHGFALLFLSECYGNTRDAALRERMHEAISLACRLSERTISRDGGWYYHPGAGRDEGSVTITQIQGLRSAFNAGIHVDVDVIDRAVEYIKSSQEEDGGVRYTLRWGQSSPALTAAGISVLHGAGEYHSQAIEKGYAYLRQHLKTEHARHPFFFYTHLYAAQAMFQRGGPEWASYFPRIRRELLDMRRGMDYWDDSPYDKPYGTAIALLILQIPHRYLPIFQR